MDVANLVTAGGLAGVAVASAGVAVILLYRAARGDRPVRVFGSTHAEPRLTAYTMISIAAAAAAMGIGHLVHLSGLGLAVQILAVFGFLAAEMILLLVRYRRASFRNR